MVKHDYLSYLLRLWRVGVAEGENWRASLEDPRTGERKAFAELGDLFAYLREQTRAGSPPEQGEAAEERAPQRRGCQAAADEDRD